MKKVFSDILSKLSKSAVQTPEMSGSQLLEADIYAKVQLDYMKFYREDIEEDELSGATLRKMEDYGCETHFAQLDLEYRRVGGGQTTLQKTSNRHIVKTNQYFSSEDWNHMEAELKNRAWKDARSSSKATIVRSMQKEFLDKVKSAEALSNPEKIRKKLKKNEKCLKHLDEVKQHGGPVSPNDLHKLDDLAEAEVLKEVRYLRMTIAPNIIVEKRKVDKSLSNIQSQNLLSK